MKTIVIVTFRRTAVRAFNNQEDAVKWIKKMCEQYKTDILDYSIENILMYE